MKLSRKHPTVLNMNDLSAGSINTVSGISYEVMSCTRSSIELMMVNPIRATKKHRSMELEQYESDYY